MCTVIKKIVVKNAEYYPPIKQVYIDDEQMLCIELDDEKDSVPDIEKIYFEKDLDNNEILYIVLKKKDCRSPTDKKCST